MNSSHPLAKYWRGRGEGDRVVTLSQGEKEGEGGGRGKPCHTWRYGKEEGEREEGGGRHTMPGKERGGRRMAPRQGVGPHHAKGRVANMPEEAYHYGWGWGWGEVKVRWGGGWCQGNNFNTEWTEAACARASKVPCICLRGNYLKGYPPVSL